MNVFFKLHHAVPRLTHACGFQLVLYCYMCPGLLVAIRMASPCAASPPVFLAAMRPKVFSCLRQVSICSGLTLETPKPKQKWSTAAFQEHSPARFNTATDSWHCKSSKASISFSLASRQFSSKKTLGFPIRVGDCGSVSRGSRLARKGAGACQTYPKANLESSSTSRQDEPDFESSGDTSFVHA